MWQEQSRRDSEVDRKVEERRPQWALVNHQSARVRHGYQHHANGRESETHGSQHGIARGVDVVRGRGLGGLGRRDRHLGLNLRQRGRGVPMSPLLARGGPRAYSNNA